MRKMLSCFSIAAFAAVTLFSLPAAKASGSPSPAHLSPAAAHVGAPSARSAESPAQNYGQDPWATPPSEYRGAERKGFHDGIEGARKDAENHRPPNVNNRDEYQKPDVPRRDRKAYREGFRRGYQVGVEHLMHPGAAVAVVPPYGQQQWENPPSAYQGAERKGFHDGIEGARQDAKNGRTPNVNNRDEYRNPDVPRREWSAYRQGFRQGYQVGVEHLMHRGYNHDHH